MLQAKLAISKHPQLTCINRFRIFLTLPCPLLRFSGMDQKYNCSKFLENLDEWVVGYALIGCCHPYSMSEVVSFFLVSLVVSSLVFPIHSYIRMDFPLLQSIVWPAWPALKKCIDFDVLIHHPLVVLFFMLCRAAKILSLFQSVSL